MYTERFCSLYIGDQEHEVLDIVDMRSKYGKKFIAPSRSAE